MRRARADLPAPHPGAAASSLRRPAPRPRPPPVSPARSPRPSPPRPPPHPRPGGSRGRGGWPEDTCPAPPLRRPPAPGQCDGGSGGRGGEEPAAGASCGRRSAPQPAAGWCPVPRRPGPGPRPPLLRNLGGPSLGARRHPAAPTAGSRSRPAGEHSPSLGSLLCAPSRGTSCCVEKGLDPKTSFLGFTLSACLWPRSSTPPPPRKGAFPSRYEHCLPIPSLPLPSVYSLGACTFLSFVRLFVHSFIYPSIPSEHKLRTIQGLGIQRETAWTSALSC